MTLAEGSAFANMGSDGKKGNKSTGVTATTDKLASNFPASVLKIYLGGLSYKSRYEGDLVAKCYFANHKLLWEVLDGGLKNKIEIQWSHVTDIKATYPDNGSGTLDVVVVLDIEKKATTMDREVDGGLETLCLDLPIGFT